MSDRVAIVGIGVVPLRVQSREHSYRELTFEAAARAYADAGISHEEVDSFVSVCEDFHEGTSITDEYTPDQLGAVLRPVHTVAGDGLQGIAAAAMLVRSGIADLVAVEAHCKTSNIISHEQVLAMALDPVYERPVRVTPHAIAALEMRRYQYASVIPDEAIAMVVVKNRRQALANPIAAHGATISPQDVLSSAPVAEPLRTLEISPYADGAVVVVLSSEDAARRAPKPVWIRGIGWASDSPWLAMRSWDQASYAQLSATMAYTMAEITDPPREISFAELDDTYAYKELQHLEATQLVSRGDAARWVMDGRTRLDGPFPVNPSGGSLGMGYCFDATALYRTAAAVQQLRGEAGRAQVRNASTGLVLSWRGVPTQTGGAMVLGA